MAGITKCDTYDFIVELVREYGQYPLDLGEYDIDMTASMVR